MKNNAERIDINEKTVVKSRAFKNFGEIFVYSTKATKEIRKLTAYEITVLTEAPRIPYSAFPIKKYALSSFTRQPISIE